MAKEITTCDICGRNYKTTVADIESHYTNHDLYGVPYDHQIAPFVCSLKCARKQYGKISIIDEIRFVMNKIKNKVVK